MASKNENPPMVSKRLVFFDVLNLCACFAVVALHVSLDVFSPVHSRSWLMAAVFQSSAIYAVPIFFMLSGANLIGYRERYSTKEFFIKRLRKTAVALLIGSAVCYILFCLFPSSFYGASVFEGALSLRDFINRFLSNTINDTYWFLYTILFLYVLTPLISLASSNKRIIQMLVLVTCILSICFPFIDRISTGTIQLSASVPLPYFSTVSLFYYVFGYYLRHFIPERLCARPARLLSIFLVSSLFIVCLTLRDNGWFDGEGMRAAYDNYHAGITSPLCVVQSSSLFLLFQSLEGRLQLLNEKVIGVIRTMASSSLDVYLFHILVINWLGVHGWVWNYWFISRRSARAVFVFGFSMLVSVIFRKLSKHLCNTLLNDSKR